MKRGGISSEHMSTVTKSCSSQVFPVLSQPTLSTFRVLFRPIQRPISVAFLEFIWNTFPFTVKSRGTSSLESKERGGTPGVVTLIQMHSYYARANTVFFTAVYSLAAVGVFYALLYSSLFSVLTCVGRFRSPSRESSFALITLLLTKCANFASLVIS